MKKLLLALMIVFLLPLSAVAESEEPAVFTFRNGIVFGMTRDEVVSCEGDTPYEVYMDTDLLYRNQQTPQGEADIHYCFEGSDILKVIIVEFTAESAGYDQDLAAFTAIDTSLIETYGEPDEKAYVNWYDDINHAIDTYWELDTVYIYHSALGNATSLDRDKLYYEPPY